jgi:HEAT repeat protein
MGEEDLSNLSKSTPKQEERLTSEKIHSEEDKARLKKVGELQKHIQKASQMIEKRSDLVGLKQGEGQSRFSDLVSMQEQPPTSFPEPAEGRRIQKDEKSDKEIEQDIESLKSTLKPLDRLSLEQYLRDLHAFDTQNRLFAVRKLGKIRRKELAGLLLDAWERETENSVRAEILGALTDMDYDDVSTVLKNALKRSDPKIVLAALEGLYRFGGKEAEEEFVKALDHPHYSVRRRGGTYLGWLEAEWAIPNLVKLLRDPDVYNRKVGVSVLSKFKIKQVIFFFIEALNDPDQGVRQAVIKALSNWTGQDLGYDPLADEIERSEAVQAWRLWWNNSEAEGFQFKAKAKAKAKVKVKVKGDRASSKQDDGSKEKILAVLKKKERGLSLKEIGEKMGAAWQGLTTVVNQLCQENLLIKKGSLYFLSQK